MERRGGRTIWLGEKKGADSAGGCPGEGVLDRLAVVE